MSPSVRPCGVCGRVQRIKRAAVDGDPDMCQACWKRDRRSWRVCGRCGELKPSQGRDRESGAPVCERCYRHARPIGTCENCGHTRQLDRTGAQGAPKLCGACVERDRRPKRVCGRCGRLAPIAVRQAADGTRDLCFACYARQPRRICGGCGQFAAIHVRGRDDQPDLCRACHRPPTALQRLRTRASLLLRRHDRAGLLVMQTTPRRDMRRLRPRPPGQGSQRARRAVWGLPRARAPGREGL